MPSALAQPSVRPSVLRLIGSTLASRYEMLVREGVPAHLALSVRRLQVQQPHTAPLPTRCALIVEPDPHARGLAELLLDEVMIVVGCESAEAALPVLRARGGTVALVFADLRLSGTLSGLDLARAVSERWPATRMILTSASAERPAQALPAGVRFMPKPWACGALLAEAHKAIGEG